MHKISPKALIYLILIIFSLNACTKKDQNTNKKNSAVVLSYIQSVSKNVSNTNPLYVWFKNDIENDIDIQALLNIHPNIEGRWEKQNSRALRFIPKDYYNDKQKYTLKINLSVLDSKSKSKVEPYDFFVSGPKVENVNAVCESVQGNILKCNGKLSVRISGLHENQVKQLNLNEIFQLSIDQKTYSGVLIQKQNGELFTLTAQGLDKKDQNQIATWSLKSGKMLFGYKENVDMTIHEGGRLSIENIEKYNESERRLEIKFSENLLKNTPWKDKVLGLPGNAKFKVDGQYLVISSSQFPNSFTLSFDKSIESKSGSIIKKNISKNIQFEYRKVHFKVLSKGSILPIHDQSQLAIEAVDLKSIHIRARKINESLWLQHFQVNDLDGANEVSRVAKTVYASTLKFNQASREGVAFKLGLKLDDFVKKLGKGLYVFDFSYGPQNVSLGCAQDLEPRNFENTDDNYGFSYEKSYWDGQVYSWQNKSKGDPCSKDYLGYASVDRKVVLISNLGLIVKGSANNQFNLYTINLKDQSSVSDVAIEVFTYQQKLEEKVSTDGKGMASVDIKGNQKPFAVVAKSNLGMAFLKLRPQDALSKTSFDVAGKAVDKNFEAYIYTNRGVYRPKDAIHIHAIFRNRKNNTGNLPVVLKLRDPKGSLIYSSTQNLDESGLIGFTIPKNTSNDTGIYKANLSVAGVHFSKNLKVEAVVPNRLSITAELNGSLSPEQENLLNLESQWLHGGIAKNFKYRINTKLKATKTKFERFSDYTFDDRSRAVDLSDSSENKGSLGPEGKAQVNLNVPWSKNPPGKLKALVQTRIYEPSGQYSVDINELDVSPYQNYVGVKLPKGDAARGMLLTDQDHIANIVMVDESGKTVNNASVEVSLYKIDWRWWWSTDKDKVSEFSSEESYSKLKTETVKLAEGKGQFKFKITYPDWGRYALVVQNLNNKKHRSSKVFYADWPGWAGRASKNNPGGAAVLSLSVDQSTVNAGETISVNIPKAENCRVLLTIETYKGVAESQWIKCIGEDIQVPIKMKPEYAPTAYASVSLLQPYGSKLNDRPIRMYGVVPIHIKDPSKILEPIIDSKNTWKPNTEQVFKVSEANGKAMHYTASVVDEGLLSLTRFKTPNAFNYFYSRQALMVRTWDVYSDILGTFADHLDAVISIGGDGSEEAGQKTKEQRRFEPFLLNLGSFYLKAGESKNHKIEIPKYLGKARIMIVASKDDSYGSTESYVKINSPLMMYLTAPRFLLEKDEPRVLLSAISTLPGNKKITPKIKVGKGVRLLNSAQPFTMENEKTVGIDLAVLNAQGFVNINFDMSYKNHKQSEELNIPIASVGKRRYESDAYNVVDQTKIKAKTIPGKSHQVKLELSKYPNIGLSSKMEELITYPHGCVEQTVSKAYPQLLLSGMMPLTEKQKNNVVSHVQSAIEKIYRYQKYDGSFSYWPSTGSSQSHSFNAWVVRFLVEADLKGYSVSSEVKNKAFSYLKNLSQINDSTLEKAQAIFVLAIAGKPNFQAMNLMSENKEKLKILPKLYLALSYAMIGKQDYARNLIENIKLNMKSPEHLAASVLAYKAVNLDQKAKESFDKMSQLLQGEKAHNTIETSYMLSAAAQYISDQIEAPISITVSHGSKTQNYTMNKPFLILDLLGDSAVDSLSQQGLGLIDIKVSGDKTVYAQLTRSYLPAVELRSAQSFNGLSVKRTFLKGDEVISSSAIKKGDDIKMRYEIKNTSQRDINHIALSQKLASSFQPVSPDSSGTQDYRNVQDDSVSIYTRLNAGESKVLDIETYVMFEGKFFLPQVLLENMYKPEQYALSESLMLNID